MFIKRGRPISIEHGRFKEKKVVIMGKTSVSWVIQ